MILAWNVRADRVLGAPECGFFMDEPHADGKPGYTPQYQWVAKAQNVSGAVNAACAAAHTSEDAWKCFMAQYTLPFIQTPYFIVNSFYDAWQWGAILAMPCRCTAKSPKGCGCPPAALSALERFRGDMIGNVSAALQKAPLSSGFLYSCTTHCGQFAHDDRWVQLKVGGVSLRDAFGAWVDAQLGGGVAPKPTVDCDGLKCNPTC